MITLLKKIKMSEKNINNGARFDVSVLGSRVTVFKVEFREWERRATILQRSFVVR